MNGPNMQPQTASADTTDSAYVQFWNEVLAPKFIRFKHVLVDGLTHHSDAVFPNLPVNPGDRVLDVGCGFGDTAIKLSRRVGPIAATHFLNLHKMPPPPRGLRIRVSFGVMPKSLCRRTRSISCLPGSVRCSLLIRLLGYGTCAKR